MVKIYPVNLHNKKTIEAFLRELFPNLPEYLYLCDKKTGKLYSVVDFELHSVHNPYTGEHVSLDTEIELQGFAGPRNVWQFQSLHSVFTDDEGVSLTDRDGIRLEARPCLSTTWSRAILKSVFGS
jgi:hypothetical protein